MEINLKTENMTLATGGGTREVISNIVISNKLDKREQRRVAVHEVLGCALEYIIDHKQLDDLADIVVDALDQLEADGNSERRSTGL